MYVPVDTTRSIKIGSCSTFLKEYHILFTTEFPFSFASSNNPCLMIDALSIVVVCCSLWREFSARANIDKSKQRIRPASMFSNVQLALDLFLQAYFLGRVSGYVFTAWAWRSWQSLGVVAVLDACGFQKA